MIEDIERLEPVDPASLSVIEQTDGGLFDIVRPLSKSHDPKVYMAALRLLCLTDKEARKRLPRIHEYLMEAADTARVHAE